MGGAYGHIMHLHEDRDLTFAQLRSILSDAAYGRLEGCTEKTDGMNLVFTWDESIGSAKVARSMGDIRSGGLCAETLAARFADRPSNVVVSLSEAFEVLNLSLGSTAMSDADRDSMFDHGRTWYSLEVIDPASHNVIRYDARRLVFHRHGSFFIDRASDRPTQRLDAPGVDLLTARLGDRWFKGWLVCGPNTADLRCEDMGALAIAQSAIDSTLRTCDLRETSTVGEYALSNARKVVSGRGLSPMASEAIAQRMSEYPGAPTLTQIKTLVPADSFVDVGTLVKVENFASLVRPLEDVIYQFSLSVLCDVESSMVHDHRYEVRRLRNEVDHAVKIIEACGNDEAKRLLRKQLSKLGDVNNITSSAEGVVFRRGDRLYKLTGAFAPVNQIMGLLRFGRGKARVNESS